ncbi:unnamed protein product [Sphenostylis stenocarpa]|uniref:Uncharacterized protein n=1 Tax=Sphenostylis stenocarpa TaxID=92480 RepID=A0AA86SY09_9FABA|nr:unnamed protein product [Sphenostylis stenocarpa]
MGLLRVVPFLSVLCWLLPLLCSITKCGGSDVYVKFLKAPHAFSHFKSATFSFQVLNTSSESPCSNCILICKLDDELASVCKKGKVKYRTLRDGNHTFELLVYGAGQVIPSSFRILQPNLIYSLLVSLSSAVQYGRAILVMDRNFCTDFAGNSFMRMPNSSVNIHFDRRKVYVNIRTSVPEELLQLDSATRTIQATNDFDRLKIYLYFSAPVLNSSAEILNSINISQGSLLPNNAKRLGDRRFGFMVS